MYLRKKSMILIVALVFAVSLFAGIQSASASSKVVETQWLADNLSNVKVIFVDNWPSDKDQYMKKHIKGSVYMGIGAYMGALGNGSAAPDMAQFNGIANRLGINKGDKVVIYGAKADNVFALGALWLMEYFGVDASYLNGGLAKWNKEGLPTEGGMKPSAPGNYKASPGNDAIRTDAAHVLASLKNSGVVFVDARGTGEYVGDVNNDNNKRVGHIPGAHDLDSYKTNFNDDGTIKSVAELTKIYESKGITKDKEVITYCQAGVKASNSYFILKHVLGYPNVKTYVGSWGEWANRTNNPIEK